MHAIHIHEQKFWGEAQLDQFLKQFGQYGQDAGFVGMMVDRKNFTARIMSYNPINPEELEGLFQAQMNTRDPMLAMPGSGKLGTTKVGYSTTTASGMIDYSEEF